MDKVDTVDKVDKVDMVVKEVLLITELNGTKDSDISIREQMELGTKDLTDISMLVMVS